MNKLVLSLAALVVSCAAWAAPGVRTVMTWNIYECQANGQKQGAPNTNALAQVAEAIRAQNADWVCLQEVDTASRAEVAHDHVLQLAKAAGLYPAFAGVFRHRHGGEWGEAILSREKPIRTRSVRLPKVGKGPGRVALIAEYSDAIVCCTHLALEESDRNGEVDVLLKELKDAPKPVILCGDLNSEPRDEPIRRLKTQFDIVSPLEPTWPSGAPKGKGQCIDYVLVDTAHAKSFTVGKSVVLPNAKASDHRAVVVTLRLPETAPSPLVASLQPPARHCRRGIMGRDFWHGIYGRSERRIRLEKENPEMTAHPAFSDAVVCYTAQAPVPPASTGLAVWPRIEDYFLPTDPDRWIVETCPDPTRPFFLNRQNCERDRSTWGSPVKVDLEAYRAWRAKRPNLIADGHVFEWCSDLSFVWRGGTAYAKDPKISPERAAARKALVGEQPKTRYEQFDLLKRYYAMRKERNFGGKLAVMDAHLNTLHIAADFGASYLQIETTASGEYRYQTSAMFTRGASRQFGVPWEWYVAGFMNGPSKKYPGTQLGDTMCNYTPRANDPKSTEPVYAKAGANGWRIGNHGPEFGISRSLFRRTHYLTYLSGADVTMLEAWFYVFPQWDAAAGGFNWSPRGRIYTEFIDFIRAHPDRGNHYSPVAVCVPIAQGYPTWGGSPFGDPRFGYTAGDKAVDAVFYTLVPGCDYSACLKRGNEKFLRNSPYADMYDVISPDATSLSPEQLLAVMKSYRALVVAGDYPDKGWEKTLAKYEADGGRVVRVDKAMLADAVKTGAKRGVSSGETRYPKLEAAFRKLQTDFFPFEVSGNCSYGLTVAKDHVWLYVLNNDGILKYADSDESPDPSMASDVTVKSGSGSCESGMKDVTELLSGKSVALQGGSFNWHLGPGEIAIFEIK